jgi:transcription elongation factor Elf1
MVTISCDVCKKKIDSVITNRTFFYYGNHSICESCKDSLEFQVRSVVRNKEPFVIEWYEKFIDDQLGKAVQKGRI